VQPTRGRQYARAAGTLSKTDKVDARVLACFGTAIQPEPTAPRSAAQKLLRELESQRRHLCDLLVAEQTRLEQLKDEKLRGLARAHANVWTTNAGALTLANNCPCYLGKFTVTVLEQFWVPASHTCSMY
jgi:transposase